MPYQAGEPVTPFQATSFSGSTATIVLFVRSTCTFCTQSMDFYRRIAGQRGTLASVQIIAAAPEPLASLDQYLRSHNLEVDHLRELPKEGYKVVATPTLLLVDPQGHVVRSWQGALNDAQESAFLQLLEQTAAATNWRGLPYPPQLSRGRGLAR